MNAIRREEREKPVLTNEAIEVHLSYLRTGLEAVQTELPKLRERIDQANKDRAAGDAALGEKIDKLTEVTMKIQGSQDGIKWFVASSAIIASSVSVARSLGWI